MDEQTRLAIMRAMLGQGLLGETADVARLQPVWQQLNIDQQMQGNPALPQYPDWYQMIRQQMPELFGQGINPTPGL